MRLYDATWSVPGYDSYGVREFSTPGPFQHKSGMALIFAFLFLIGVWSFGASGYVFGRPALYAVALTSSGALLLIGWVYPLVKDENYWELDRWVYRHLFLHCIVVAIALFGLWYYH